MKVRIVEGKYLVSLKKEEMLRLCRPGAGADTCIWLVVGAEGFECLYFCREVPNLLGETLKDRWEAGKTVAKRDGCPEIETMRSVIILKRQGMTDKEAIDFIAGCKRGLQAIKEGKVRRW
ncbi:hypothetical protein ES708_31095 [subsurface metagenome]